MKICSFNVNSIRTRLDLLIEWIERRGNDIDILCLQETKVVDELFPFDAFKRLGYTVQIFGQKAYNGVALCAKSPLEQVGRGFGDPQWDLQKRLISAVVQGVHILNVYAPHGDERGQEKYFYKLKWYKELLDHLSMRYTDKDRLIVLGDLNVALEDQDVYDARALRDTIGTMPEEREALAGIINWGLCDTFRTLYPDKRQYTWWGYMGGAIWKDQGMRIDYILATAPLCNAITQVEVDMWPRKKKTPKPSDHAPLIALVEV